MDVEKTPTMLATALLLVSVTTPLMAQAPEPTHDAPPTQPAAAAEPAAPPPATPAAEAEKPLAGYHDTFFLRDPEDNVQFFPRASLHIDTQTFWGPGVRDVPADDNGSLLKPRMLIRRLRFELGAMLFKRIGANLGVDFGQSISNANGKTQTSAASAGDPPTATSARWAAVQGGTSTASIANAWIDFEVVRPFHIQIGQTQTPITMENRTGINSHTFMERIMPIRAFVAPPGKEIGITFWGDLDDDKTVHYETALVAGDGPNRPQVDGRFDVVGRVFARPLTQIKPLKKAQIGVSGRFGSRDTDYVGYSYPAITTGQGWTLWEPRYDDSLDRRTHVIPSGQQRMFGGELRVPYEIFELRGEAYYVANDTREAIDGFQLTATERRGTMRGVGWYAMVGVWPLGDAFVNGDPGFHSRPTKLKLDEPAEPMKKGLEVAAIVQGVEARYDGAARTGDYDPETPGADGKTKRIRILAYGLGLNYWYTKRVRLSLNYILYTTPGSADGDNQAQVPGNTLDEPKSGAEVLHEVGTRVGVNF